MSVVRIKPVSRWAGDPIEIADNKILKKLETTPMKGEYYHIQILQPKQFYKNPYATSTIGLCLFETDRIPLSWVIYGQKVDAIWSTSEFNHKTFDEHGLKNKLVPFCGVDLHDYKPGQMPLENPHRKKFNFISSFEWTPRKGWDLLLQAYWREFAPSEKVSLTIKTYFGPKRNRKYIIGQINQLKQAMQLKETPTTIICTDLIPDQKMPNFYSSGDCYVTASRGEGMNMGSLEASALGLPVIASEWGGDSSYLPKENLIGCKVEPINSFEQIDICSSMLGHCWGKPSVENLRHLLRHAYEHKLKSADPKQVKRYDWHDLAENIKNELGKLSRGEKNGKEGSK